MSFQLSLSTDPVTAAHPGDPIVVAPSTTVGDVLQLLRAQRTGSVLICEDGRLAGIFTERDALKWMAASKSMHDPVSDAMSRDPVTLRADATVGEAIQTMAEGGYRHLPILADDGSPASVAAVHGIVHYMVDHFPQTIYNLPPEPRHVPSEREGA